MGMNNRQSDQRPSINLNIDKLVLHGFSSGDKNRIARAVETELARLLGQGEIPATLSQSGVISQIDAGTFHMRRSTTPETIGEQVSRNLYGALNQ